MACNKTSYLGLNIGPEHEKQPQRATATIAHKLVDSAKLETTNENRELCQWLIGSRSCAGFCIRALRRLPKYHQVCAAHASSSSTKLARSQLSLPFEPRHCGFTRPSHKFQSQAWTVPMPTPPLLLAHRCAADEFSVPQQPDPAAAPSQRPPSVLQFSQVPPDRRFILLHMLC